ncbi:hypothetical protein BDV93DRAFT_508159 [Ceratobasidium sp. AG-I]|nr:hypothetical protein BDV93DRAFT_508159 [Ceratobasidium sp. AG-I]
MLTTSHIEQQERRGRFLPSHYHDLKPQISTHEARFECRRTCHVVLAYLEWPLSYLDEAVLLWHIAEHARAVTGIGMGEGVIGVIRGAVMFDESGLKEWRPLGKTASNVVQARLLDNYLGSMPSRDNETGSGQIEGEARRGERVFMAGRPELAVVLLSFQRQDDRDSSIAWSRGFQTFVSIKRKE